MAQTVKHAALSGNGESVARHNVCQGHLNWFAHTAAECAVLMNGLALFDQSSMTKPAGVTTSGMFGHRLEASPGMGYSKLPRLMTPELISATRWEIGVGDRRVAARAQLAPWYHPKSERIRA